MMTRLLALACLASTGCFTSWVVAQQTSAERILDEGVREERVPLPDVRERLRVSLPLTRRYPAQPVTTTTAAQPAAPVEALPFELVCTSTQTATDTVYRSGFRYGRRWKVVAAAMFVLEGSTAAFMYFGDNRDKVDTQLAMGFLALDAIGTAVIALIPRKEVHRRDEEPVTSPLRTGCPAGLLVEIAGETFPVDAAGRIGEIGEAALDEWMRAPSPAGVRVSYHNRTVDLQIGQNELCTWNRDRHQDQSACPSYWAQSPMVSANLEVPLGTLTRAD